MKVILVASGKGGTGKTSFTAGVGAALSQRGHRVLLIDGDCGLRNLDIVLGMSDRVVYSFADVAGGAVPLETAMARHPDYEALYLLTAPVALPALSERGMEQLAVQAEEAGIEYLLIDGPAGLPAELSWLAHISTQAVVVTSTDRACIRGAERCARKLEEEYCIARIRMVLNRIRPQLICRGKAGNIDDAMDEAGLPLLGVVPEDEDLISCGNSGKSIFAVKHTGAARAFQNIARRLDGERVPLIKI
ncbi:P-loop NTPase [Agathobaculum sp. NSJ-28]|uniref:P-loop NTPase n=2 Tax=Agathobaculum TaxID=2048137 RepID=A0A923LSS8_9FIRM|nr:MULTISPECIES: P-loop NTPase [Butyricicoccaceae]MBS6882983.1 P-loop NTPase [Clostridiaceae bacterium]SCI85491.1 Cell division inhibitor MinD [uncultured Butyricicoccus sp.]MBC5724631.1 P-loop NTPase [Agathobaculum faecis]MCU6788681.1 P-loop NTPase [Agathobaculum ammoniilyticum]WOC76281.1 P-loop NTPase [Intestinibacillus sp. NTUH-41-i26]